MMLSKEEIGYIAELAKLSFSQEETEELSLELSKIISKADKLNELDTKDVEPLEHIACFDNAFRKDLVVESFGMEKLMECAPSCERGYYNVPMVME